MRPIRKRLAAILAIVSVLLPGLIAESADAQNNPWGDIITTILNNAIVQGARKSWQQIDVDVRNCIASQYNVTTDTLADQGIGANDARVANALQTCNQLVAQQRYQQQQEQARIEEQQRVDRESEAAREKAEQNRLAEEKREAQEAERQRKEDLAKADAERKAHHQMLVARFGEDFASAIEAGQLRKGMSKDAVREARGAPQRIEKIPPDDELWIYASDRIAITKGKVSYVGH